MDNVDSVVEYDKATRKGSKSDALEDIYDLKEKLEKNDHFLTEVSNKNDILTKENKKLKEEKAVLVKEKDEALSRYIILVQKKPESNICPMPEKVKRKLSKGNMIHKSTNHY